MLLSLLRETLPPCEQPSGPGFLKASVPSFSLHLNPFRHVQSSSMNRRFHIFNNAGELRLHCTSILVHYYSHEV